MLSEFEFRYDATQFPAAEPAFLESSNAQKYCSRYRCSRDRRGDRGMQLEERAAVAHLTTRDEQRAGRRIDAEDAGADAAVADQRSTSPDVRSSDALGQHRQGVVLVRRAAP